MTDEKKKFTKDEKIHKANNILKELATLELNDDDLKEIAGG